MDESSNKRKVAVGVFVLIGVLFLIGGILMIGNLHETFKKKITLVAMFDDVSGLQSGNNVWFSGVKIGSVSDLQFYSQHTVKVTMNIEEKAQPFIRKDAFVKVSTDGLIGNKILIIYGGSPQVAQISDLDSLAVEKSLSSEDVINTLQQNNKNFLAITNDIDVICDGKKVINTLQQNNKNFLAITNDIKDISAKLSKGEGTVGKLLNDEELYNHLNQAAISLQATSSHAQQITNSLSAFSEKLNTKGGLVDQLTTDTTIFNSLRNSATSLQLMSDSASAFVNNLNKAITSNNSPAGVLMNDKESAARLQETIKNLESGSKKLDEDLEALQHNFLFRGYFKDKQSK